MKRTLILTNLNNSTMLDLMMSFLTNIGETDKVEETARRLMDEASDTVEIRRETYTLTSKVSNIGEKKLSICYTDNIERIDDAINGFCMEIAMWEDHLMNCYEASHDQYSNP